MPTTAPKTDGRETRAIARPVELRSADAGSSENTAAGYAALYNSWTVIGPAKAPYWRERLAPGVFQRSLAENDVLAVHSHDIGRVMGRTGAGTLTLTEDDTGLAFVNPLPNTQDGRDLAVSIERKDIPGMSFAFVSLREEWDETVSPPERTILEAELYEITYSAMPAYADTTVGLRSLEHARQERQREPRTFNLTAAEARTAQLERGI